MIVLAVDPILRRDGWPGEKGFEVRDRIGAVRFPPKVPHLRQVSRLARFTLVNGRFVCQFFRGDIGNDLAIVFHDHAPSFCNSPDFRPRQVPFVKNALHLGFAASLHDNEHALL